MAKKIVDIGSNGTRENQVKLPEIDSDALNRRAAELTNEIQREYVMDNEKVSRIKAEIENGTYKVNPEAIATKLLECDFQIDTESTD